MGRGPVGFGSDSKKVRLKIWAMWKLNSGSHMIEGKESTENPFRLSGPDDHII
jgi:hypothetical protein